MAVRDSTAYRQQLQLLLPPGDAWNREAAATLTGLLDALADEMARIDARIVGLADEVDPRTTTELLTDWERVTGLPDACLAAPGTIADRRNAVAIKLSAEGGQHAQFYIDLAADAGYTITLTEPALHTMQVNAPATTVQTARAGSMRAGDQLRTWGVDILECLINYYKPAHVVVLFAYV